MGDFAALFRDLVGVQNRQRRTVKLHRGVLKELRATFTILKKEIKIYPRVIEHIEDWPIYRLSKDRAEFIREIDEFTFQRIAGRHRKDLPDVLVKVLYQERIRIKEDPWKVGSTQ